VERRQIVRGATLQDCRERRLVTGAGAAALERKDPYTHKTPLIAQVQLGEYENAKRLLQAGADPNAVTEGGERALLIAAKEGREDLVELLLGFKAEVDTAALHWASQEGHLAVVQLLLKAVADIEAKDQVSLKREPLTRPLVNLNVTCMRICGIRFIPDTVCGCH